jgi:hypothetical protein
MILQNEDETTTSIRLSVYELLVTLIELNNELIAEAICGLPSLLE